MSQRRNSGLCYNCPAKYSREHMKECLGKGAYLLEVDGETTIQHDGDAIEDAPKISLNAITSIAAPMTMHLSVSIAGAATRDLVDSGLMHCLGLLPLPRSGLAIGVANSDRIPCAGLCPVVRFRIDEEEFYGGFFVVPLGGFVVVLGCQWLRTLGPILWGFDILSMSFWPIDHRVHWRGIDTPACAHILAIATGDLLKLLIAEFATIFAEPQGLPPPRRADRRIHLLPGTPPVAMRPYRYLQLLKDEIEKQCATMLQQGIILAVLVACTPRS